MMWHQTQFSWSVMAHDLSQHLMHLLPDTWLVWTTPISFERESFLRH
jgi:hypothetical protein